MKKDMLHDVSDALMRLRRIFAAYEASGVQLSPRAVGSLMGQLMRTALAARRMEYELGHHRWHETARHGRRSGDRTEATVAAEASRPDTNVLLFPAAEQAPTGGDRT
jgi:hypothetical protein